VTNAAKKKRNNAAKVAAAKSAAAAKAAARVARKAANKAAHVPPPSRSTDLIRGPVPKKNPGACAYSAEKAERIFARMRNGENMNQICRDPDMPYAPDLHYWKRAHPEEFGKPLEEAQDALYEFWAHETMDISDDGSNDWIDREVSQGRIERSLDHEHIARSKLRIDTRKWLLGCLKRDKYGSHVQQEVTGKDGAPFAAPVLNVIIDGGGAVVNGSSSASGNAGSEPPAPPQTGLGFPVKRD
jgi:hypothetical protein